MSPVFDVYAYCLLPNHFHFLIGTKTTVEFLGLTTEDVSLYKTVEAYSSVISGRLKGWLSGCTQALNGQEGRRGSIFMHNTKRRIIRDRKYLLIVLSYIHLNPLYHGSTNNYCSWRYSSYAELTDVGRPTWTRCEVVYTWFDNLQAMISFHGECEPFALEKNLER